jgi:hypothetical protein
MWQLSRSDDGAAGGGSDSTVEQMMRMVHRRAAMRAANPRSTVEPKAKWERFGGGIGKIWRRHRKDLAEA